MLHGAYIESILNEESGHKISDDTLKEIIGRLELTQEQDYRWYAVRHADAYVDIHICGRHAIMNMERYGITEEQLDETINYYFKLHELPKRSENAHWWGLFFSPVIENENKQKVWIRFPEIEKPIWFYIDYFDAEDGLVLSPNPRKRSDMRLLKMFDGELNKICRAYPKTIEYAIEQADKYFEEIQEYRPARSDIDKRIGFLVYPEPQWKSGCKVPYTDVGPVNRDNK